MAPAARRRIDRLLAAASRLAAGVFFRRVEVVGAGRVPTAGPLIVVANHVNGLVDPVLLLAAVPARSASWPRAPCGTSGRSAHCSPSPR